MNFLAELKRRNVFRVAAAYVVSSWLIVQVVETIFPAFGFGDAAIRAVVITLAIGLLPVLVISWAFELTPEGLKPDREVDREQSITTHTGKRLDRVIVVVLAIAVGYFAFDKFVLDPARDAQQLEDVRQAARTEAIIADVGDRSIAVLPFADMSPAGDQAYFSEGIAEELLNLLATIPEVRVTSRSSAFSMKEKDLSMTEIADQLRVSYVLDGSVRKAGDQVRISAQLIDAQSDTQLWSRNFDRTLQNIFQIQDEIAGDVVNQIKGTLNIAVPDQRETDPKAYALFLEARDLQRQGTAEGYDEAIALYRRVLEIDPNYPPAWDNMAAIYQSQAVTGLRPAEEGFQLAEEAALRAIEVDPEFADAYSTLAFMAQYREADLSVAADYLRKALELAPNDASLVGSAGMLLQNLGRLEEGVPPIEYTVARDPLSAAWNYTLGIAYLAARQNDDAVRMFEKTLELSPDFSLAWYHLGSALMLAGDVDRAVDAMRKEPREAWRLTGLTMALYERERQGAGAPATGETSDQVLAELEAKYAGNMTYNLGYVYAHRGDADRAFQWLDKAVEVGDTGLGELLTQPLFGPLHDDPRWVAFLRERGQAPEQLEGIQLSVSIPE